MEPLANGKRVYIDYSVVQKRINNSKNKQLVMINNYTKLLTKSVIKMTTANQDSIGNDPFSGIQQMWITGDYLNIIFTFAANNKSHLVNLAENYVDYTSPLQGDTIQLVFRQNSYNDLTLYNYQGIVSFDISSLKESGRTSVILSITVTFRNNTRTYYRTFKYNESDDADFVLSDIDFEHDNNLYN